MECEEDNVQNDTNPNEQNGGDADTLQRPITFEDAVNCLIETSHETQTQVKNMQECFQTMTSQLISVITNLSDAKKINRKFSLPKNIYFLS